MMTPGHASLGWGQLADGVPLLCFGDLSSTATSSSSEKLSPGGMGTSVREMTHWAHLVEEYSPAFIYFFNLENNEGK